jgi:hypothetical protein
MNGINPDEQELISTDFREFVARPGFIKICNDVPNSTLVRRISDMSTNSFDLWSANLRTRRDRNYNVSRDHSPPFTLDRTGSVSAGFRAMVQPSGIRVDAVVWIASCLLTVLGLAKAAVSEQPFLWVVLWPAPVVLASTVFTFLRQGFHFQDGMLVLGRRRSKELGARI